MTDTCGRNNRDGEPCGLPAGWGTDHTGEGACKFHGGASSGAPEDNTNAVRHGAYVETNKFYQEILSEEEREFVDDVFADYLEAYRERHGEAPLGDEAELFNIAVSHGKHVQLDNWPVERPDELDSGVALVDRETRYSQGGARYHRYKESVVSSLQLKLSRERRAWLKDLGLLEDPQSQTADAVSGLISIVSSEVSDGNQ